MQVHMQSNCLQATTDMNKYDYDLFVEFSINVSCFHVILCDLLICALSCGDFVNFYMKDACSESLKIKLDK